MTGENVGTGKFAFSEVRTEAEENKRAQEGRSNRV
jgi:hypothetical protein